MSDIQRPATEVARIETIKQLRLLFDWCQEIASNVKNRIALLSGTPNFEIECKKYNDTVIKVLDPIVPQFLSPSITQKWRDFVFFWNQRDLVSAETVIAKNPVVGVQASLADLVNIAISSLWNPMVDRTQPRLNDRSELFVALGKNSQLLKHWMDYLETLIGLKNYNEIGVCKVRIDQAIEKLTDAGPILLKNTKASDPQFNLIKGMNDLIILFKGELVHIRNVASKDLTIAQLAKCRDLGNKIGALGDGFGT